jgi:AraC-like DNA-binding protein
MASTFSIPLVREAVLEPIFRAAQELSDSVNKHAGKSGLPGDVLEHPDRILPLVPALKFIARMARESGDPTFGIRMAQPVHFNNIKTVIPFLVSCSSLYGVLQNFCRCSREQCNIAEYVLVEEGDKVWLLDKGLFIEEAFEHRDLFEVTGMIQLVQLAAGPDWRPDSIHFRQPPNPYLERAPLLNPSRIRYKQPYNGIAFERELLALPTPSIAEFGALEKPPETPLHIKEQLLKSIHPYLGERKLDQKWLSELAGMSLRTLQRRLSEQGLTLGSLIDEARCHKARFLLQQTDEKLLDIALMLGYENASSFTRAFQNWNGISPREFRKIFQTDNVLAEQKGQLKPYTPSFR